MDCRGKLIYYFQKCGLTLMVSDEDITHFLHQIPCYSKIQELAINLILIFIQPTRTNRYLHFSSHHPRHVKEGVVSCFFHRARTVAQGENVAAEEEHLRGVLEGNGYPETFVKTASKPRRAAEPTEEPRATALGGLPIIIHPSGAVDASERSRSTREEVQRRIPSPVQLWPCLHR